MTRTRAAIYCRISRDKTGAGLGVERQEAECRELAERLGWTVVAVYPDNDLSAYSGKPRPQYRAMLDAIRRGEVDAVLAWHGDRLHRSPVELEQYIDICNHGRDVPTHCVKAGELDLSTASGRMTARIVGAVARHESEHKSERITSEKAQALGRGEWIGSGRPFGYVFVPMVDEQGRPVMNKAGKPKMTLGLDPAEAAAIRDGVARVIAGESVYSITKSWQATIKPARGERWAAQNVHRILTRPRNARLIEHKGVVLDNVRGTWPEITLEDDFRAVCAILKDPKRTTYSGKRSLKWVGSGLYVCGRCGADLRSATTNNGTRSYRCRSGSHVSIPGEPLDEYVIKTVCEVLDREGAALLPTRKNDDGARLHEEANTLRARLEGLADMLGDGELDRAAYNRQKARVTAKLDAVTAKMAERSGSAFDGIATAPTPSVAFRAAPVARQRAVVDALCRVTIAPAGRGRLPKGVEFDYSRVTIEPKTTT
ncbi:recombinase family protein [Pseudonocardia sp. MH-G8]|uniref:recombinase family protein n=1 Tax=Pseudonocardia sp. MH-G8 TaxID=1854588 RepID=UPI000BA183CB|nr:recombinase family protein [Pseudonocardia sp. MH-G8]OZM81192.1 recombinase family protein [Pseudonocardia sp. MH-G8]